MKKQIEQIKQLEQLGHSDYQVNYSCSNCNRKFRKRITYGIKAPESTTCPHCGCNSGVKSYW